MTTNSLMLVPVKADDKMLQAMDDAYVIGHYRSTPGQYEAALAAVPPHLAIQREKELAVIEAAQEASDAQMLSKEQFAALVKLDAALDALRSAKESPST